MKHQHIPYYLVCALLVLTLAASYWGHTENKVASTIIWCSMPWSRCV